MVPVVEVENGVRVSCVVSEEKVDMLSGLDTSVMLSNLLGGIGGGASSSWKAVGERSPAFRLNWLVFLARLMSVCNESDVTPVDSRRSSAGGTDWPGTGTGFLLIRRLAGGSIFGGSAEISSVSPKISTV